MVLTPFLFQPKWIHYRHIIFKEYQFTGTEHTLENLQPGATYAVQVYKEFGTQMHYGQPEQLGWGSFTTLAAQQGQQDQQVLPTDTPAAQQGQQDQVVLPTDTPTPTATSTLTPTNTLTPTATHTPIPPTATDTPPPPTDTPVPQPQQSEQDAQPQLPTDGSLGMIFPKISKDHITVEWSDMGKVLLYFVEISRGNYYEFVTPGAGTTSHDFGGLQAGTTYTFRITAYQDSGVNLVATGSAQTSPKTQQAQQDQQDQQILPSDTPTATATNTATYTPTPTNTPSPTATNTPIPPTNTPAPSGPYASLMNTIIGYRDEQGSNTDHYKRWARALAALGYMHSQVDPATLANPVTVSEAQGYVNRGWGGRWQPVVDALTQLNPPTNTPIPLPTNTPVPPPTNTPVPPPTNTPVPPTNTPVPPTNTPVPPPTNTPVPPSNTPVPPPTNTPVPPPTNTPAPQPYKAPQSLIDDIKGYITEQGPNSDHVKRWRRVLHAFGEDSHEDGPMGVTEAEGYRDRGWDRWIPVVEALKKLAGG